MTSPNKTLADLTTQEWGSLAQLMGGVARGELKPQDVKRSYNKMFGEKLVPQAGIRNHETEQRVPRRVYL